MSQTPPRLLIFDLDGTLVDSRIDLCNAVNATLRHFGKPLLTNNTVASYIGDGVSALVRRSLAHSYAAAGEPDPHDEVFVHQALTWFLDYYRIHLLDATTVYPGVLDALGSIRASRPDMLMAVLTNKPVNPSRVICSGLGLAPFFFQNYGGNSFATKKPDAEGLLTLIREANARLPGGSLINAFDTVMIGDSHVDVETARNAGCRSLGCTYGLSPESVVAARPDQLVQQAAEWPAALGLL